MKNQVSVEVHHLTVSYDGGPVLWDIDFETQQIYFSDKWLEISGYQKGEIKKFSDWFALIHKDDREKVELLFEEIFKVDAKEDFQLFFNLFNQISQVEKHFSRKENQLFPYLEKYGWTSPSQGMWAFHDQIRAEIKVVRKAIEEKDLDNIFFKNARRIYKI